MNTAYSRWVEVKGTMKRKDWPARGLVAEKSKSWAGIRGKR